MSTKKEDLVHILDHWNIQVDNPVSLLDQDTSRHFLHSNNPAHKYKVCIIIYVAIVCSSIRLIKFYTCIVRRGK